MERGILPEPEAVEPVGAELGQSRSQSARTRFSVVGTTTAANTGRAFRSAWSKRATTVSPTSRFSSARSITCRSAGSTGPAEGHLEV